MEERLSPQLIELAYRQGIFPMAMEDGEIGWFRPDRRAIIPMDRFYVSRSLRRSARQFEVRFNTCFGEVMRACADRPEGSWIDERMIEAYSALFEAGKASSAEAYLDGKLVGGVYGVSLGKAFMAESMFHTVTDAGKTALWMLIEHLRAEGSTLFDVQYMTEHLRSLGAIEVSHEEYMLLLHAALNGF